LIADWLKSTGKLQLLALTGVVAVLAGCGDDNDNDKSVTKPATVSCESKGINATTGNVGTCARDGVTYTVVNKNQTLPLEELDARVVNVETTKEVVADPKRKAKASGLYVIVTLQVKNKSGTDQQFGGPGFEQMLLAGGGHQYPEGGSANSVLKNSFLTVGKIGSGKTATGKGSFDVPRKIGADLTKSKAVLAIANFTDAGKLGQTKRLGIIRLWK
jgi:Domain of unknown function (DUF4352)